jgi:hypothetical protein
MVAQVDTPRTAGGTVPGTVPGVVSEATPKGFLESSFTPVPQPVCSVNPTATWQSIPKSKCRAICRLSRVVCRQPNPKVTAGVIAKVICEPVWRVTAKARPEASFWAPERQVRHLLTALGPTGRLDFRASLNILLC